MGTKEAQGSRNNAAILDWAKDLDIHYPGDDVPWCGLFVAQRSLVRYVVTSFVLPESVSCSPETSSISRKQIAAT